MRGWRAPMDSRLRGNDDNTVGAVDPVMHATEGMKIRTAPAGTPPIVIPAKAGIHRRRTTQAEARSLR